MADIKILLVDDHEVVRRGLRSLLDNVSDFEIVGEAGTAEDAVRLAKSTKPDVVVLDVRLPDQSGVEACREIRSELPDTQVLMLTSYADDEALFSSIMAGAAGYVLKQVKSADLVGSIRQVAEGKSLLDAAVTDRVLRRLRGEPKTKEEKLLSSLSAQERKILDLIAEGKTNREIANEIFLAEKTVKNYVSNLLMKLGMARRSEAAAFAARMDATKEQSSSENSKERWP